MAELPRRPAWIGTRGRVLLIAIVAAIWAGHVLDIGLDGLVPSSGGLAVAARFFRGAFHPALYAETSGIPLLPIVFAAVWRTVAFAAAAVSVSLIAGAVLAFFGATAWWSSERAGGEASARAPWLFRARVAVYVAVRAVTSFLRSIHELFWAVLFLVAFGLNNLSAVIAIAIPFTGTFAKVVSEIIDEAPRDAAHALQDAGATPLVAFVFGLVPRALPDVIAYAMYRFECAMRSSTVLGFFGYDTLGLYIRQSFEETDYAEVWTFFYALLALIVGFEAVGAAVRRRIVA